jgi:hypothetical protein
MTTAAKPKPAPRTLKQHARAITWEMRAEEPKAGSCGQLAGVALVYQVRDSWGTRFLRGCLDKTRAQKVAAGKVQLYIAEDSGQHQYGTRTHIGVVRALRDVGDNVVMDADLFDTEAGRRATGLSVGVYPREGSWNTEPEDGGEHCYDYAEVELAEITITPMPAVPGTEVTAVRSEVLQRALVGIIAALGPAAVRSAVEQFEQDNQGDATVEDNADAGTTPDTRNASAQDSRPEGEPPTGFATMDERLRAVRQSYARG